MKDAPSMNAQHPASAIAAQKREWKKPMLDILALADAQGGHSHVHDGAFSSINRADAACFRTVRCNTQSSKAPARGSASRG